MTQHGCSRFCSGLALPARAQSGFSLTELAVTAAIASTLAAVSLPNLSGLVQERATQASSEAFRSALRLARNEAVRRGETLTLCARDPQSGDAGQACLPRGSDWSAGWLLFVDRGERGVVDPGDRIVRVHQLGAAAAQVLGSTVRLSFQPTGISLNAAANFRFLPRGQAANAPHAVLVCINKAGRARVNANALSCS